jgi:hypothetical protein
MAHYPMGTTSANHADLLYFLAPSVSAGQRPFIPMLDTYAYAGQVGDIKRFAVLLRSERASHALDTFDHFD